MKRLKAISVLVSAAMCMSMIMTPVSVIADETPAPAETQKTEETEKPKPKETEKPAPKETAKPKPKETEKPAPKETEKQEPKETEKPAPKETVKQEPKETEKPAPKETEKQEPVETEKQEPKETEKQEPAETEKQEPAETEKQEPAETEKQEPAETEKQEPAETDKQEPSETEQKEPEETTEATEPQESGNDEPAPSEEPEASESEPTETTDENVTKAPQNDGQVGTISNIKVTNGVLSWNKYSGATWYDVYVFSQNIYSEEENSCSLNAEIDDLIKNGNLTKGDSYRIRIEASTVDSEGDYVILAKADYKYTYKSPATTPAPKGDFANVKVNKGVLTWDKVKGASYYEVDIYDSENNLVDYVEVDVTSVKLTDWINSLVNNNKLDKSGKCLIKLYAVDEDGYFFAYYRFEYSYKSSATPKALGTIKNVRVENGYLRWDAFANTDNYEIKISKQVIENWIFDNEFELDFLNSQIDFYVKDGKVKKGSSYTLTINAYDGNLDKIATVNYSYKYDTKVNPIKVGSVSAKINKGILTWSPIKGKSYDYSMLVCSSKVFKDWYDDQYNWQTISDTSINVNDEIEDLVRTKMFDKDNTYVIVIQATDEDGHIVAETRLYSKTLNVSGVKTVKAKARKLRKKKKTVARNKIMTLSDTKGSVTYSLKKVNKKKKFFKINKHNGKLTIKKKLKKGKYKVTYRITASGNDIYAKATKDVTVTVRVK